MTNQESYRDAFDHIKAPESITADRIRKIAAQRIGKESTMDMETGTASENKIVSMDASAGKLHRSHRKAVRALRPLIAAAAVVAGCGVCYANNVGGIQRSIQIWTHGQMTTAEMTVTEEDGMTSYDMTYKDENGKTVQVGGGGVAYEKDGSERPLTAEELQEELNSPEVETDEKSGKTYIYYMNQKIDITDKFKDGYAYVKVNTPDGTLYVTVKQGAEYAISSDKFITADEL